MLKSTPRKNRQGSLSPSKLQSESNVSPWRIKVTVEAEHEDEMNNNGSVARKRFKSGTMTTKVPLKDGEEASLMSAKRRRGRPRKSDIQEQSATPSRGSPGRTPGRTPGPATASAVRRKRGRPRKSLPEPEVVDSVETDHLTPAEPTQREPTPLNLAVEGDAADLSSDDGIPSPAPLTYETGTGHIDVTSPSPIRSENRQVELSEPPRKMARILEGDTELAPSKSLSPDRELRSGSPENTMHAGHTPRPRRIYPTPTSSSLIDGENPGDDPSRAAPDSEREVSMSGAISDPTNEHREFDSIMESEGFSMVSLDTLPSAKSLASARSLPSAKQQVRHSNLDPSKPALKPFFERQTPGSSDRANRRASGLNFKAAEDQAVTSSPQNEPGADQRPTVSSSLHPASDSSNKNDASRPTTTPAENILYPQLPDAPAQAVQSATTAKKRSFPSLAKVVRAGIALQGILRRQRRGSHLQSPFSSPGRSGTRETSEDSDGPRRRLEHLFSGFGLETQRELRAGLRFGEELARQREAEERRLREGQNIESSTQDNAAAVEARGASFEAATPEQSRENEPETGRLDSEMARRQAEWQREREAVSREIEMANSSKVIVIDSDVEMSQKPEEEEEGDYESEQGVPDDGDDDDDDGDYDIWQQEAHASRLNESSISHHQEDNAPEPDRGPASSPWKSGQSVADSDNGQNLPPILWDSPAKQSGFPSLGKSRLRKLKEEEVDLSALLRRQDTPNRRRYYGNSSPQSRASQQQQSNEAHHPSSPAKPATSSPQQPEQVSPSQRQSVSRSPSLPLDEFSSPEQRSQAKESPDRSSDRSADEGYFPWEESPGPRDSASQQSGDEYPDDGHPDYEHPDDERPDEELYESDDLEPSHADISGNRSMDQTQTSQPARQTSAPPASSWFRRLTNNFTPRFWRMGNSQSPEKQSPSKHLSPQFDKEPLEELPEEEEEEEEEGEGEDEQLPDEEHPEEPVEESDEELDEEPDEEPPEEPSEDDEELPDAEHDEEPPEDDEQLPDASPTPSPQQSPIAETPLPEPDQISASPTLKLQPQRQSIIQPSGKPPLAVSGYFTDNHYYALRRLYRLAQRSPELFPYYPTSSREDIIGDWLWTSDGAYGLPVTELQFAIVDRFMEELADGDIQNGGTGEIGWSEEELYKRLFSIIIGEQIRRQRKAQALEAEEREREREREEFMSNEPARRASVASWRQ